MLSMEPTLLKLDDVKAKRFKTVRMQLGYEMTEMDIFLNQIEETLKHYEAGGDSEGKTAEEREAETRSEESSENQKSEEKVRLLEEELEEARMRIAELEGDLSRAQQDEKDQQESSSPQSSDDTMKPTALPDNLTNQSNTVGNKETDEKENDSMLDSLLEDHAEKKQKITRKTNPFFLPKVDSLTDNFSQKNLIEELEAAKEEAVYFKKAHAELAEEMKKQADAGNSKSAARMLEIAEKTATQLIEDAEEERKRLISGAREGTKEELQQLQRERTYLIEANKNLKDLETHSRQRLKEFFSANLKAMEEEPVVEPVPDEYKTTNSVSSEAPESSNGFDSTGSYTHSSESDKAPSKKFIEALKEAEGQPNPYAHMLLDKNGNVLDLPEGIHEGDDDEVDRLIEAEIEAFQSSLDEPDSKQRDERE